MDKAKRFIKPPLISYVKYSLVIRCIMLFPAIHLSLFYHGLDGHLGSHIIFHSPHVEDPAERRQWEDEVLG